MPIHVALLRGINVGGRNLVGMRDLRDFCESLGVTAVRTLLQSGNVVFDSPRRTGAALERLLEKETKKRFGIAVDYVVRTGAELQTVIECNPFPDEAERDPSHLLVTFFKQDLSPEKVTALAAAIRGREMIRADGRHLYAVFPDGIGTSKVTTNLIERTLGCRGTGRNWNTVLKLATMAGA